MSLIKDNKFWQIIFNLIWLYFFQFFCLKSLIFYDFASKCKKYITKSTNINKKFLWSFILDNWKCINGSAVCHILLVSLKLVEQKRHEKILCRDEFLPIFLSVTFHDHFIVHVEYFRVVLDFGTAFSKKCILRKSLLEIWVKKLSCEVHVLALFFNVEVKGKLGEGCKFSACVWWKEVCDLLGWDVLKDVCHVIKFVYKRLWLWL